eukprot:TRINITY_DN7163_c0_g1_i1.p1 TRINITY_DN7163_c0_g1~~TRINITY_DN7163_c0_g1_i1.p1  ORF type:complete len:223 (-),score=13.89 TRINITY_DN7163_c0_g1_i1:137-805(-)
MSFMMSVQLGDSPPSSLSQSLSKTFSEWTSPPQSPKEAYVPRGGLPYHEKQSAISFNCAVHAVNNILQEPTNRYTHQDFQDFANSLHKWGPTQGGGMNNHSNVLGYFSGDVVFSALKIRGFSVEPLSARGEEWGVRDAKDFFGVDWMNNLCRSGVVKGVLVNQLSGFLGTRHWLAVTRVEDFYWNLDSLNSTALPIPKEKMNVLLNKLNKSETYMWIVYQDS